MKIPRHYLDQLLTEVEFVVVDLETTGLYPFYGDKICEIAAVSVKGEKISHPYSRLVNPERPIATHASLVNGITNEMVLDCPLIDDILPEFLDMIKGKVLIAHNAKFDIGFLVAAFNAFKIDVPDNIFVDTLYISRKLHPEFEKHSLPDLRRRFNLDTKEEHRALSDVMATARILQIYIQDLELIGITRLNQLLQYQSEVITFKGAVGRTIMEFPSKLVDEITFAINNNRLVELNYEKSAGNIRVIEPYRIISNSGEMCIVAFCKIKNDKRTFRVDRIIDYRILDETFVKRDL